ncbi:MAG: sulfotransferase [Fimbriimonadaceae bacterium]|nr:sulfotransferase [Chitinophagales bacterium]
MNKLPTFLIVGAVKAGTTSLHEYLQQHPEVFMSPIKETNYFSDTDMLFEHFNLDYKQDISTDVAKYLSGDMEKKVHIAHVRSWEQYQQLFRDVKDEKAIGEVSNSYLYLPSSASAIKQKLADTKIVMILRNPIERLYSQFLMNLRLGKIAERDLLKEIQIDQDKKVKGWGVSHLYLEVGNYYEQVKRYYDLFPATQIKVIVFDDFKKDAKGVMKDLFQFVAVNPDFDIDMSQKYNEAGMPRFGKLNYILTQTGLYTLSKKIIPENFKQAVKKIFYSKSNIPKITAEEKKWLADYYRHDVNSLSQLLNRDLSGWLR